MTAVLWIVLVRRSGGAAFFCYRLHLSMRYWTRSVEVDFCVFGLTICRRRAWSTDLRRPAADRGNGLDLVIRCGRSGAMVWTLDTNDICGGSGTRCRLMHAIIRALSAEHFGTGPLLVEPPTLPERGTGRPERAPSPRPPATWRRYSRLRFSAWPSGRNDATWVRYGVEEAGPVPLWIGAGSWWSAVTAEPR